MIAAARRTPWWYLPVGAAAAGVAALLPPFVGLALAVLVVGGTIVLARPVWGVYALVLSVPVQREISLAGHGTATQGVMAFLLFAWWVWMATHGRPIRLPGFALALVAYLSVMAVSLLVAGSLNAGLAEIARWTVVLLSFVIIVNTVRTRTEITGLVICFFAGMLAEALLGLWQFVTKQVPPSFFVGQGGPPQDLAPRAFGTIGAPNSYAGYLNMTLALAIAVSVYLLVGAARRAYAAFQADRSAPPRVWLAPVALALGATAVTGLAVGGLLVSFSRGGLIGLGFGLVGMAIALGRRAVAVLVVLAIGTGLLATLALAGALPAAIDERLITAVSQLQIYDVRGVEPTPENYNQVERLAHWEVAGNMFLYDPWLGIGVGNYNLDFARFGVERWLVSQGQAHNYYLQALAETGLAGLVAYLIVLGVALRRGWQSIRRAMRARDGWACALLIGAFGVVVTIVGHSVFEDLHVLNMGIHWAAVISLFYLVRT